MEASGAVQGVVVCNPRVLFNCCVHGVPKGTNPCATCSELTQASKPAPPPGMRVQRVCPHGRARWYCRECRGSAFCLHYVQRKTCWICRGTEVCKHTMNKAYCAECGGRLLCQVCRKTIVRVHKVCARCRRAALAEAGPKQD